MAKTNTRIPVVLNTGLMAFIISLNIFQLFILPLYLLPLHKGWALIVIPLIPLNILHWSLIHEAVHKVFAPGMKANERAGRALSIVFGGSFDVLRFGHLMHHRFNRQIQSEFLSKPSRSQTMKYYWELTFGTYVMEILASTLIAALPQRKLEKFFKSKAVDIKGNPLPQLEATANAYFFKPERITHIRQDVLGIIGLYSLAFWAYGAAWPVLVAALMGRALMISYHDNVYHYGTAEDNTMPAKELELPAFLSRGMLNFNYHLSHHMAPFVPWTGLPQVHREKVKTFDQSFFEALSDQLKGPILKDERVKRRVVPASPEDCGRPANAPPGSATDA